MQRIKCLQAGVFSVNISEKPVEPANTDALFTADSLSIESLCLAGQAHNLCTSFHSELDLFSFGLTPTFKCINEASPLFLISPPAACRCRHPWSWDLGESGQKLHP